MQTVEEEAAAAKEAFIVAAHDLPKFEIKDKEFDKFLKLSEKF